MGDSSETPQKAPDNVAAELRGNNHRILLVKAAALGLISLISLSQLGTGAKLGSGGPKFLLPVTLTFVVFAALLFGFAYRNMAFASAQLDARLKTTVKNEKGEEKPLLTNEDKVPFDIKKTSIRGWKQARLGIALAVVAVIFYLVSVWWAPAAASAPGKPPSSASTPPTSGTPSSSTTAGKQSPFTATPPPSPTTSRTATPAASVTVTPTVSVTVIINLPPAISSAPSEPGRG
jgi:hypothetical protein